MTGSVYFEPPPGAGDRSIRERRSEVGTRYRSVGWHRQGVRRGVASGRLGRYGSKQARYNLRWMGWPGHERLGIPFRAFYSASKFALEGLGEALAYEVAPFGVHVTLVEPGNVKTDFTASRRMAPAAGGDPVYGAALTKAVGSHGTR
jgi:NAD(P)-dependent dehydrogenase (short-subunit alcohol dehydrogenase family)